MDRAVERGLQERELDDIEHVGLDKKSFGRGHDYISILTDINGSRVLEVSEGRDEEAANVLWETFADEQKEGIKAVAMDIERVPHLLSESGVIGRGRISEFMNKCLNNIIDSGI